MANLSVRFMVALFCIVLVVTPALLITLLTEASDQATKAVLPPVYWTVMKGVRITVTSRLRQATRDMMNTQRVMQTAASAAALATRNLDQANKKSRDDAKSNMFSVSSFSDLSPIEVRSFCRALLQTPAVWWVNNTNETDEEQFQSYFSEDDAYFATSDQEERSENLPREKKSTALMREKSIKEMQQALISAGWRVPGELFDPSYTSPSQQDINKLNSMDSPEEEDAYVFFSSFTSVPNCKILPLRTLVGTPPASAALGGEAAIKSNPTDDFDDSFMDHAMRFSDELLFSVAPATNTSLAREKFNTASSDPSFLVSLLSSLPWRVAQLVPDTTTKEQTLPHTATPTQSLSSYNDQENITDTKTDSKTTTPSLQQSQTPLLRAQVLAAAPLCWGNITDMGQPGYTSALEPASWYQRVQKLITSKFSSKIPDSGTEDTSTSKAGTIPVFATQIPPNSWINFKESPPSVSFPLVIDERTDQFVRTNYEISKTKFFGPGERRTGASWLPPFAWNMTALHLARRFVAGLLDPKRNTPPPREPHTATKTASVSFRNSEKKGSKKKSQTETISDPRHTRTQSSSLPPRTIPSRFSAAVLQWFPPATVHDQTVSSPSSPTDTPLPVLTAGMNAIAALWWPLDGPTFAPATPLSDDLGNSSLNDRVGLTNAYVPAGVGTSLTFPIDATLIPLGLKPPAGSPRQTDDAGASPATSNTGEKEKTSQRSVQATLKVAPDDTIPTVDPKFVLDAATQNRAPLDSSLAGLFWFLPQQRDLITVVWRDRHLVFPIPTTQNSPNANTFNDQQTFDLLSSTTSEVNDQFSRETDAFSGMYDVGGNPSLRLPYFVVGREYLSKRGKRLADAFSPTVSSFDQIPKEEQKDSLVELHPTAFNYLTTGSGSPKGRIPEPFAQGAVAPDAVVSAVQDAIRRILIEKLPEYFTLIESNATHGQLFTGNEEENNWNSVYEVETIPIDVDTIEACIEAAMMAAAAAQVTENCRFTSFKDTLACATDVYLPEVAPVPLNPQVVERGTQMLVHPTMWKGDDEGRNSLRKYALVRRVELPVHFFLRRTTIVLATDDPENTSGADIFAGTQAASVIVGVSVSAGAILLVLSLLHYVFHPLKVIGATLRACADINFFEIEPLHPSRILEILVMQKNVELLVQRMRHYGKYMPDRSQLVAVLDTEIDLKDFQDTDVTVAPLQNQRVVGAIPHNVNVVAEYRSRKRPQINRSIDELRKYAQFSLMYSSGDNVHEMLLEQCRVRFGERIGELLELRHKGTGSRRRVETHEAPLLRNSEDVHRCVESLKDNSLHLIVVKSSKKTLVPWLILLLAMAATVSTGRLASIWISDLIFDVSRAGLFVAFLMGFKLFVNLLLSLYLLRRFVLYSQNFGKWVSVAMQELLLVMLASAFTVNSLMILFSHTRITFRLKFNAPFTINNERLVLKYATVGYFLGEITPLVAISYVGVTHRSTHIDALVITSCVLLSTSSLCFVLQKFFPLMWQRFQRFRASRSGLESQMSLPNSEEESEDEGNNTPKRNASQLHAPLLEGSAVETGAVNSAHTQMNVANLRLAEREATVLKLSFVDAISHLNGMNTVEIQLFCEKFLNFVFAEVKLYGGMVMRVQGTEVLICFNCHRLLAQHALAAIRCFFAIRRNVIANILYWCADDTTTPKLIGGIVSGGALVIGYAGRSESRSLQHIGIHAKMLDDLCLLADHLHAQLLVTQDIAALVELWHQQQAELQNDLLQSWSSVQMPEEDPSGSMNVFSPAVDILHSVNLRDVEVLEFVVTKGSVAAANFAKQATRHETTSTVNIDEMTSSEGSGGDAPALSITPSSMVDSTAGVHVLKLITVFELCEGIPAEQVLSSRAATSLLHSGGPVGVQTGGAVRTYIHRYPLDKVIRQLAVFAGRNKLGRKSSSFGLQLYQAERFAGAHEEEEENDKQKGAFKKGEHQRFHPLLPKIMQQDSYTLYFTDI